MYKDTWVDGLTIDDSFTENILMRPSVAEET
jgi:hypothetical protein